MKSLLKLFARYGALTSHRQLESATFSCGDAGSYITGFSVKSGATLNYVKSITCSDGSTKDISIGDDTSGTSGDGDNYNGYCGFTSGTTEENIASNVIFDACGAGDQGPFGTDVKEGTSNKVKCSAADKLTSVTVEYSGTDISKFSADCNPFTPRSSATTSEPTTAGPTPAGSGSATGGPTTAGSTAGPTQAGTGASTTAGPTQAGTGSSTTAEPTQAGTGSSTTTEGPTAAGTGTGSSTSEPTEAGTGSSTTAEPTRGEPTAAPSTGGLSTSEPTKEGSTTAEPTAAGTEASTTAEPTAAEPTPAPSGSADVTEAPTSGGAAGVANTTEPTTAPTTASTTASTTTAPTTAAPTTAVNVTTAPTSAITPVVSTLNLSANYTCSAGAYVTNVNLHSGGGLDYVDSFDCSDGQSYFLGVGNVLGGTPDNADDQSGFCSWQTGEWGGRAGAVGGLYLDGCDGAMYGPFGNDLNTTAGEDQLCEEGQKVVGISATSDGVMVDNFTPYCGSIGKNVTVECPDGSFITDISVQSDTALDYIGNATCSDGTVLQLEVGNSTIGTATSATSSTGFCSAETSETSTGAVSGVTLEACGNATTSGPFGTETTGSPITTTCGDGEKIVGVFAETKDSQTVDELEFTCGV